ncbi:MAG: gliding motility protein GldN [Paludibacter sp.]|nr:gliding motility protein GldN [Paludibacter sp.]
MKKYWIVSFLIFQSVSFNILQAQLTPVPFFNKNGTEAIQTTAMNALADTIAVVNHRADDIVWSRKVYRIIDMRDKQNYQLYFPVVANEQSRSLFRLILDAALNDSLRAYDKVPREISPLYNNVIERDSLPGLFVSCERDTVNNRINKTNLIERDPITQQWVISNFAYKDYVKNQIKFLVLEDIFFDKHTSRLYNKIIAIAPIYTLNETNVTLGTSIDTWSYFQSSVLCWFLFDELRPFLARQFVIPNGNDTQRLTFDEYFAQRLYSSYLLGESNMTNRMIIQSYVDPVKIKREQQKIETELLNFEQDLWEY